MECRIDNHGACNGKVSSGIKPRFPFPPEGQAPLPSVLDLLRYIEEEPAPKLPSGKFSAEFEKFTGMCLIKDPDLRPNPATLLKEEFCIKGEGDLSDWAKSVMKLMGKE